MSGSYIRVADAPILSRKDLAGGIETTPSSFFGVTRRHFFVATLICLYVVVSLFLATPGTFALLPLLVALRYVVWVLVLGAVYLHCRQYGLGVLTAGLMPFLPFLLIACFTGLIGVSPIGSARLIVTLFVLLCAGVVIGHELGESKAAKLTVYVFAIMLALSIATVMLAPDVGTLHDKRTEGGDWRGLFWNKGSFGSVSACVVLFALIVPMNMVLRAAMILAGLYAVLKSGSAGSVGLTVGIAMLLGITAVIREMKIPVWAKSLTMFLSLLGGAMATYLFLEPLTRALGRDPTLTGRTDIWAGFLHLAGERWATGFGPGSFTFPNATTADLTSIFAHFGRIETPHNIYIAILGETTIIGLAAWLIPMLYFVLVYPQLTKSRLGLLPLAVATMVLAGGIAETRDVFGTNMDLFMLIFFFAASQRQRAEDAAGESDAERLDGAEPPVPAEIAPGIRQLGGEPRVIVPLGA